MTAGSWAVLVLIVVGLVSAVLVAREKRKQRDLRTPLIERKQKAWKP